MGLPPLLITTLRPINMNHFLTVTLNNRSLCPVSVYRSETETRQLHQVVSQLRLARKVTKEDIDTVIAERDELKRSTDMLTVDNDKLKAQLSAQAEDVKRFSQVWLELNVTRGRLEEVQSEMTRRQSQSEAIIEDLKRKNGQNAQLLYEAQVSLEASLSDTMLIR